MKLHKKSCTKTTTVINRGKRSKATSDAKLVKNRSKNPESFLKIHHVQKEVPPLWKVQDHAYELTLEDNKRITPNKELTYPI